MYLEEIKFRARDKIFAEYQMAAIHTKDPDPYWKIDQERAKKYKEQEQIEVDVLSYILSLIEKDI